MAYSLLKSLPVITAYGTQHIMKTRKITKRVLHALNVGFQAVAILKRKIRHAWIQEFSSGVVVGGPGQSDKKALTFFFFFSPRLHLLKLNGKFRRKLSFFKVPEGVQQFPGGSNFFQEGGSNCLFPIKSHITCDFPGWGPDPCPPPPLDPHLQGRF